MHSTWNWNSHDGILPFIKRGGFKFIETAHVKDLLAHLRVIHNPLDTVSWNRLLLLLEGVGPKKSKDLIAMILQAHGSYEGLKHSTGRSAAGLRHLAATLEQLTEEPLSPAVLLGRDAGILPAAAQRSI